MNTAQRQVTEQVREGNGQFGHWLDKVCRCGARKGEHLASRPFPMEDETRCAGFRVARKAAR